MGRPNPGAPLRVYVVEDNVPLRRALIHEFKEIAGVEVVGETGSVARANTAIREVEPDVLIVDFNLEDGDALQILQAMQTHAHHPLSIVMTNDPLQTDRQACLAAGATHFLDKSLDFALMLALLTKLANG
jgi:DNA-binding NarL/FixJ family response regulator